MADTDQRHPPTSSTAVKSEENAGPTSSNVKPGKRRMPTRAKPSESSSSSSSSESETDSSDDWSRRSDRLLLSKHFGRKRKRLARTDPNTRAASRKQSEPHHEGGTTTITSQHVRPKAPWIRKRKNIDRAPCSRDHRQDGTKDRSRIDDEKDRPNSTDDDSSSGYRGPHLRILSVRAINDRLNLSLRKWGISTSMINEWAAWWPKTTVAQYHKFDAACIYLLTWAVYVWWDRLWDQMSSLEYKWPESTGKIDRAMLLSRVKEIALIKEGAAVRGERDMRSSGKVISPDSVIKIDH